MNISHKDYVDILKFYKIDVSAMKKRDIKEKAEHLMLVALGVNETEVLLSTKKDHAITQQQTSPDWRLVIGVKALFNQRWLESHYRHNQQINSVASASKPSS